MYRFLLSARWIGLGLLMTLAAATMVGLGLWQLSRYHYRSEINTRIDAATTHAPLPLASLLAAPVDGRVGAPPDTNATWNVATVTGRYDQAHEILARIRTLDDTVGFEVITPLVLADGTAILIDRGWLPAPDGGATLPPVVPAAPAGEVTVVGRVHAPESRATPPEPFASRLAVRRVGPDQLAGSIPYPLYGAYLTLESQSPPSDAAFVTIPPDHENAAMNAGYVLQWWAFALLTLFGFGYLAYRQAHPLPPSPALPDTPTSTADRSADEGSFTP